LISRGKTFILLEKNGTNHNPLTLLIKNVLTRRMLPVNAMTKIMAKPAFFFGWVEFTGHFFMRTIFKFRFNILNI
jgi:hypothetical protein